MSEASTYRVPAMSCSHCKAAVEAEVGAVAGVAEVDADLETKRVTVRGEGVDDDAVRAAIGRAGYEVA